MSKCTCSGQLVTLHSTITVVFTFLEVPLYLDFANLDEIPEIIVSHKRQLKLKRDMCLFLLLNFRSYCCFYYGRLEMCVIAGIN